MSLYDRVLNEARTEWKRLDAQTHLGQSQSWGTFVANKFKARIADLEEKNGKWSTGYFVDNRLESWIKKNRPALLKPQKDVEKLAKAISKANSDYVDESSKKRWEAGAVARQREKEARRAR
jgi:hypothetical protein